MTIKPDALSSSLFNNELDKLPEPYKTKFLEIVNNTQKRLLEQTYTGDAGAGLLSIEVTSTGTIKKLSLDPQILQQFEIDQKFTKFLDDSLKVAHTDALENINIITNKELSLMYEEILKLSNTFLSDKSN